MRTPAGLECRYFYGDYYRGRNHEECRLILDSPSSYPWTRDLCKTCPVPGIITANSCPNMVLSGEVKRTWFGLVRRVQIRAFCTQNNCPVSEPHIGCGKCHPLPPIFESNQK